MIYFIHGTDIDKAKAKARDLVDSLRKKKPDASFFKIDADNWNPAAMEEYVGAQGLFENKFIILVDRIGEDKVRREELIDAVGMMAESNNIFIILEGKLDKVSHGKIEKKAEKTQEFALAGAGVEDGGFAGKKSGKGGAAGAKDDFNIFALGDALGRRDKKQLWVLYRQAIDAGKSPEEIHGTLFWQVKSIVIASRAASAGDSGLAPFVYSKSKGFAANFLASELTKLFDDLISISHDARRGMHELEVGLERVLLEV